MYRRTDSQTDGQKHENRRTYPHEVAMFGYLFTWSRVVKYCSLKLFEIFFNTFSFLYHEEKKIYCLIYWSRFGKLIFYSRRFLGYYYTLLREDLWQYFYSTPSAISLLESTLICGLSSIIIDSGSWKEVVVECLLLHPSTNYPIIYQKCSSTLFDYQTRV